MKCFARRVLISVCMGCFIPLFAAERSEEKGTSDAAFASIQKTGLIVTDGKKWYYEHFDRQGRAAFAALYEDGTAVEHIFWSYKAAARRPFEKKTVRSASTEMIRYDDAGRELVVEYYEKKILISKTENVYNSSGRLIKRTVTAGENVDESIWDVAGDKTVSQTKYRNGKKISFIELHTEPHIVHLYVDDKEVFVEAEP